MTLSCCGEYSLVLADWLTPPIVADTFDMNPEMSCWEELAPMMGLFPAVLGLRAAPPFDDVPLGLFGNPPVVAPVVIPPRSI